MSKRRSYDIVLLALARDCARTLPSFFRAMDYLGAEGAFEVSAIIGENGSRDSTRALLEAAAAANPRIRVVDTSSMAAAHCRLQRMAIGRELLAQHIDKSSLGVVCVVDVDEPFLECIPPETLYDAINRLMSDESIFAVAASSRPTFYDLLAYEDDSCSFETLQKDLTGLKRHPFAYYRLFRNVVYPAQRRLTSDFDIRCRSSFNGLALYDAQTYVLGSYLPSAQSDFPCEHVTFNRSLCAVTGRRMVVSASLVLPTPVEHGPRTLAGFVWQRAHKWLRLTSRAQRLAP